MRVNCFPGDPVEWPVGLEAILLALATSLTPDALRVSVFRKLQVLWKLGKHVLEEMFRVLKAQREAHRAGSRDLGDSQDSTEALGFERGLWC